MSSETTNVVEPTRLTAFWRYDRFPFVLSGTVIDVDKNGFVKTKEYDTMRFRAISALPGEIGVATAEKLKKLGAEYEQEQRQLMNRYLAQRNLLTPFKID